MDDSREQRAAVKFCFLLEKTFTKDLDMLKTAYKDELNPFLSGFPVLKGVKCQLIKNLALGIRRWSEQTKM